MKRKLTVLDRLLLLQLLPRRANLTDIKIIHKLRMNLAFDEEEQKLYKFKNVDGKTIWEGDKEVMIEIGERGEEIIREALKELDKRKELTENHIRLCEMFNV